MANKKQQDDNKDLEKKLQEAQSEQDNKSKTNNKQDSEKLIRSLERKIEEAESIAKKAQSDYINLKFDFDSYMNRMQQESQTAQVDTLLEVVKKFIPFINGLNQSLSNIPESEKDDDIVQGVQMVYNKFLSTLENMNIFKIESIGKTVDVNLHEAVSAQPVDNKSQKDKIIQEFEQGFIYKKGDMHKILAPAKVVIGQ